MDIESIFELPIYFIKENLNGWVILILISIIIYFIILRNYYVKREQFWQDSSFLEKQDLENPARKSSRAKNDGEENPAHKSSSKNHGDGKEEKEDNDENEENNEDEIDYDYENTYHNEGNNDNDVNDVNDVNDYNDDNSSSVKNSNEILEGFESPTTTNYASVSNNNANGNANGNTNANKNTNTISDANTDNTNIMNSTIAQISTTLFDNIKLNSSQLVLCKTNYSQVINTYIVELKKLNKLKKGNEYLNTKKQFDIIIATGIDNITSYLANTIKSPLVLTRSSIRKDVLNILTYTLESLIDKTNANLSKYITNLANMNSTTIDYKSMMTNIDAARSQIEEYVEIENIINSNESNLNKTKTEVNNILNKSHMLPIYEKNFDRINQLINSDFNNNETNLANKYGQAYSEYLNEKKKDELDINPLRLASKIESGIVNMISNLSSNTKNKYKKNDIIEQINPIPEQNYKLVNNTNLNKNANIYNDRGNLGNYLIDAKTQKQVLEGFDNADSSTSTTTPSATSQETSTPKKKNKKEKDFMSQLLSGDFIQYVMDNISDKMTAIYGLYDSKYGSGQSNDKDSKFNIEENMIPMGFLFFILSMLIYFIDTTS
jgi:hypothetical protein